VIVARLSAIKGTLERQARSYEGRAERAENANIERMNRGAAANFRRRLAAEEEAFESKREVQVDSELMLTAMVENSGFEGRVFQDPLQRRQDWWSRWGAQRPERYTGPALTPTDTQPSRPIDVAQISWGTGEHDVLFIEAAAEHSMLVITTVGALASERIVPEPMTLREIANLLRGPDGEGVPNDMATRHSMEVQSPFYPQLREMLTTPGLWP